MSRTEIECLAASSPWVLELGNITKINFDIAAIPHIMQRFSCWILIHKIMQCEVQQF